MKRLLICADASSQIGTGHVRRMLTLAAALTKLGASITFQTGELGAEILNASEWHDPVNTDGCEPSTVLKNLENATYDGVILDSYSWDATNEKPLRSKVNFIAAVDDLANRLHDVDFLIDQNANQDPKAYDRLLPKHCVSVIGGSYCLLPNQFQKRRCAAVEQREAPIFVSMGGGDPNGDLFDVVETLLSETALPLTIATGKHISDASRLEELANRFRARIDLVFDSDHVADQMEKSQFAVASGGTMTWERASMGLPSICLIVADNQLESSNWLAQRGFHIAFDLRNSWDRESLADTVRSFVQNDSQRQCFSKKSVKLVARDGAVRAARALLNTLEQFTKT